MAAFFASGGIAMIFVVVFGLLALGASTSFALRPDGRRVEAVKSLSIATVFSVFAAVAANLAAVGYHINANEEWARSSTVHLLVLEGVAESLSPAILGCSVLAVVWMIMAVGHRRLRPQLPA